MARDASSEVTIPVKVSGFKTEITARRHAPRRCITLRERR
jgi:hypothetical protein